MAGQYKLQLFLHHRRDGMMEKVTKMWENCVLAPWKGTGWQLRTLSLVEENSPWWNGNINNLYAGEGILKYSFLSTYSSSFLFFTRVFIPKYVPRRQVSLGREDLTFLGARGGSFIDSWNSSASLTSPPLRTRGGDLLITTWTRKFQTLSPCSVNHRQFPLTAALSSNRI